jgi:ribonuclease HI
MYEYEELLAVAYKKEKMRSRRLAKGASLPEHDALVLTLTRSAGMQSLPELVETRRAEQAKAADAQRIRLAMRTDRAARVKPSSTPDGWIGWFDGSALPNPGRIGIGGVLRSPSGETIEISAAAGHGDSSAAEYLALIALLETALREGAEDLMIHGDSRVVIDDIQAKDGTGIRSMTHHAARVRMLMNEIGSVRLQWIPRARNASADALSRRALDAGSASASATASASASASACAA